MKKMKNIYSIFTILFFTVCIFSCQEEDSINEAGYLRLAIETNSYVNAQTKVADDYNPKQIAIQILNANNEVVKEEDDWEMLKNKQIRLTPGTYTIKASSNGFDGSESGFDIPYYAGSTQVTVVKGKEVTADITCTLANVKVTINFDRTFMDAFNSAEATVASKLNGVATLNFKMGTVTKSAYFPVGNLTSTISVVNHAGKSFSQTDKINGVKARDHYILNYKVAESGSAGGVNVTVDDTQTIYTFTFNVSTEATTSLDVKTANAWSNFAYLEGSIGSSVEELDATCMTFEYKPASADAWTSITAAKDGEAFKATLTGLTPNTAYVYRMVYKKGSNEYASEASNFTTESQTALVNGNLDDWYKSGKTWYAASEAYFTANGSFWDSSNPGTTTEAGAIINVNPTQGNSSTVHTAGGKSAELKSQYAGFLTLGQFAAASLYTGSFSGLVGTDGAKIDFGQPFTARPTQLHGWFQYSTAAMNYVGNNTPASLGIVKGETPDVCSIYIALTTRTYQVDNTKTETFIDFDNDEGIVAYGELPLSESVPTNGAWKEFNIDLKYRNLTTKPTHIIIVCSASKYGDYFTGSDSSLMYVDDLELIYGNTPSVK